MLSKYHRLPATVILKSPQVFFLRHFTVKVAQNMLPQSRFGFVVSKKVDPKATARNRIKRLTRSCIEELCPEMLPGNDFLFFLKKEILVMNRTDLYNEIHSFLKKNNLLA